MIFPERRGRLRQFDQGRGGRLFLVREHAAVKFGDVDRVRQPELLAVWDCPLPWIGPVLMSEYPAMIEAWRRAKQKGEL